MLIVAVKVKTAPGKRDLFIKTAQPAIAGTRKEEGNICYELYASSEDADGLMYFEKWVDRAALDAHMKSPHIRAFAKEREDLGLLAKPSEVTIYEVKE